eukprot:229809_1
MENYFAFQKQEKEERRKQQHLQQLQEQRKLENISKLKSNVNTKNFIQQNKKNIANITKKSKPLQPKQKLKVPHFNNKLRNKICHRPASIVSVSTINTDKMIIQTSNNDKALTNIRLKILKNIKIELFQ